MTALVDTNVVLRLTQPEHAHYPLAWQAIRTLRLQGERFVVVPQVLYEFWVVATRPLSVNGLGLSIEQAHEELQRVLALFECLSEAHGILALWESLVVKHRIIGRRAHDARLAAAMGFHGITRLLTFNAQDFTVYPGLEILDPARM